MGKSGSGPGLSIVYGVVKDHNGYVDVRTKVGVGSEFLVYLPVTRDGPLEKAEVSVNCRGTETVLVVDDIEEQRQVVASLLTSLGYCVETAENGRAAVQYLKSHDVDLLILDMIMEDDFDGLDTYRLIKEFRPAQQAIIVSDYSETRRVREAQKLGAGQYIRKPYALERIGRAVGQGLEKATTTVTAS